METLLAEQLRVSGGGSGAGLGCGSMNEKGSREWLGVAVKAPIDRLIGLVCSAGILTGIYWQVGEPEMDVQKLLDS
jgi:hypothetical protein